MTEKERIPIEKLEYDPANIRDEPNLDPEFIDSVRDKGVIHPLVVRPRDGGKYGVVAGKRRLLAARKADLDEVPCVVREDLVDDDMRAKLVSFEENLKRKDLPMAKKKEMIKLVYEDTDGRKEKSKRVREVADRANLSTRTVRKHINIGEKLNPTLNARVKEPSERSDEEIERLEEFISENPEALRNEAEPSDLEKEKAKGFPGLERIPIDVAKELANSEFFQELQEKDPGEAHKIATEAAEAGRDHADNVIREAEKEKKKEKAGEKFNFGDWTVDYVKFTVEVSVDCAEALDKLAEKKEGMNNRSVAAAGAIRGFLQREGLLEIGEETE